MKKVLLILSILIVALYLTGCSSKGGGIPNCQNGETVEMTREEYLEFIRPD